MKIPFYKKPIPIPIGLGIVKFQIKKKLENRDLNDDEVEVYISVMFSLMVKMNY